MSGGAQGTVGWIYMHDVNFQLCVALWKARKANCLVRLFYELASRHGAFRAAGNDISHA